MVLVLAEEDDKDEDASQTDEDCFLGSYRGSEALARHQPYKRSNKQCLTAAFMVAGRYWIRR